MTVIQRLRDAGFEVYTRKEWGSPREAQGWYAARAKSHPTSNNRPYHFLHITVTPDTDTKLEGFEGARKVESYGLSSGAPMVSYQMLVTNEAKIFEGQAYNTAGTHTVNDKDVPGFPHNLNYYGTACAIMQDVGDEVSDEQVVAIASVFAAAELEGHVVKFAPIFPHRKFDWKSCPGDKAVARLEEIQQLKDGMVRAGTIDQGDNMPLSDEDITKVADAVTKRLLAAEIKMDDDTNAPLRRVLRWIRNDGQRVLSELRDLNDETPEPTPPPK